MKSDWVLRGSNNGDVKSDVGKRNIWNHKPNLDQCWSGMNNLENKRKKAPDPQSPTKQTVEKEVETNWDCEEEDKEEVIMPIEKNRKGFSDSNVKVNEAKNKDDLLQVLYRTSSILA